MQHRDESPDGSGTPPETPKGGGPYANYALAVLVLVYVFNFIDRQILSILAQDIKDDLGLSDASIGFLYGTAFAVFYAIFGIPLGRLADIWVRRKLIAVGLFFWSAMTALSGTARSFASLATFRIGVGVGESSASPAAFSMLGDYFPPRLRATAVAIYSSGVYIGSGIGLFLGGLVVDTWNNAYPQGDAPFGLAGWQAAFFVVGIPGLLMAVWVWTLKEPVRGSSEGLAAPNVHPAPFRAFLVESAAVLPVLSLWSLWRSGGGVRSLVINLGIGLGCVAGAWGLIELFGAAAQWIALAIGLYAFFSWLQGLGRRDGPAFAMIYRSRTIVYGMIGFAWISFVTYGIGFWAPSFFLRVHAQSATEAGLILGLSSAIGGWIGVAGGGVLSDRLRRTHPRARLLVGIGSAVATTPVALFFFTTGSVAAAYGASLAFNILSSAWIGSAIALATELVLPRMRATASAFYILAVTFIGLALGPFTMGQISDGFVAAGAAPGEALRRAMLIGLSALVVAVFFLWLASRSVADEESTRLERARLAGEPV